MLEARLDNGMRVVTERVEGVRSAAVGVWVRQGAAYETPNVMGISHLLEHLVFKGTERRNAHEIALSLESLGGSLDAYTTREHTSYQARVLDEHLPTALDVLADLVLHPRLDAGDLDLERGVVLEEIAGVEDAPDDLVFDLHGARLWKGHPYGQVILGTRDTVGALEIQDLRDLHRERYRGQNILIACAGNVEHDAVVEQANELFGKGPRGAGPPDLERPSGTKTGIDAVERDSFQTHIVFGNDTPPHDDPIRDALIIVSSAFGGGMSSRLFQRVREELGLAYTVFSYQSFYRSAGSAGVYVGTKPESGEEAMNAILSEYRLLHDEGLTREELDQTKSQGRGQITLSMESTGARLLRLAGFALRGEPYQGLEESLARVEAVTMDEVRDACIRFFDPDDQYVLSLGP